METVYEYYTDEKRACVSSDEKKVVNRITALAKDHPDDVLISKRPENNDGVMVAYVPRAWIRLPSPPKTRVMSEEHEDLNSKIVYFKAKNYSSSFFAYIILRRAK